MKIGIVGFGADSLRTGRTPGPAGRCGVYNETRCAILRRRETLFP